MGSDGDRDGSTSAWTLGVLSNVGVAVTIPPTSSTSEVGPKVGDAKTSLLDDGEGMLPTFAEGIGVVNSGEGDSPSSAEMIGTLPNVGDAMGASPISPEPSGVVSRIGDVNVPLDSGNVVVSPTLVEEIGVVNNGDGDNPASADVLGIPPNVGDALTTPPSSPLPSDVAPESGDDNIPVNGDVVMEPTFIEGIGVRKNGEGDIPASADTLGSPRDVGET